METINEVYKNLSNKVSTPELNDFLLPVIQHTPPPAYKGKYIKVKYITQLKSKTATIILFCNLPQYIREPYRRFIENKLRQKFDFKGVPLKLFFRKK